MADRSGDPRALRYDPAADAADRFPDWIIRAADLGGVIPEAMSRARRVILVEHRQSAVVQRCSLAHALAHLDIGHAETLSGWFENREEADADELAARRLIPIEALAHALAWTREREEVAHELEVDLATLAARERSLRPEERRRLRRLLAHNTLEV